MSFAGKTLDKCIILQIRTLTGCPLCKESQPLCRLKNPTVISIWLLVGFHPATLSVHSTPADNTRKRVWQYIEKEKKPHFLTSGFFHVARYKILCMFQIHLKGSQVGIPKYFVFRTLGIFLCRQTVKTPTRKCCIQSLQALCQI